MRRLAKDLELQRDSLLFNSSCFGEKRAPMATAPGSSGVAVSVNDYLRLAAEVEAFRYENASLAGQLIRRDLFCRLIEIELNAAMSPTIDPRFTPLTREEAMVCVTQTLQNVSNSRLLYASDLSFQGRPKIFGWSQYCERCGGAITFAVKKAMPNVTPRQLAATVWEMIVDSNKLNRLGPSQLKAYITVAQRITDDVVILDRRTEDGTHAGVVGNKLFLRTIYVAFRTEETDGSITVALKTINLPLVKKLLRDDEIWCDIFYWMHYSAGHDDVQTVDAEFGGANTYAREDVATSWLEEVLFLATRWETLILPGLLLPVAEEV